MELYGLLGERLSHSLSPEIHEPVFKYLNIEGKYNLFSIKKDDFSKAVESLKVLGIKGVNVTIPYKEEVMKQLDFISEEALKIGAVNTISIKDGKAYGYNTDYYGFHEMLLREDVTIENKEFYILGAGGASKAVVHCLIDNGAKNVTLVSRDKESAKNKFKDTKINIIDYSELKKAEKAYAIVNTTPCGMYPNIDSCAVDDEILKSFDVACDIVYNPEKTKFLALAQKNGLKIVGGLFMLVGQGIKAEEIWSNQKIDKNLGNEIFEELKKKFN